MSLTLEERALEDPWGVFMEALKYEVDCQPCPDDLQIAVSHAAGFLVALTMKNVGVSEDRILDLVCDSEYDVKLSYDFDAQACSVELVWEDGTTHSMSGQPGQEV